ncbi:peptide ABC transporter substrate-binding protein [Faecalibacillus intestinalis]|uniref:peptide ABC transporter substrate-binding protein n=1 Tax=Faecalibacillus intestinalis TaxID=1982626 RepID=UPI00295EB993|nr:peptide ABC transporter substrate-binding protein [Faecalibacillus intestinalis]
MKKLLSMVLCAMMALTLAGCGGSSDDSSTYTYSSELDIKNLDSSDADDGCSFTALHAIIDGLMKPAKDGTTTYGIAKSSEVSEDGLTHTYKLRDAKWSNGDAVTANDFVYAWQRIFKKKGNYYYMFCDGIANIAGAQELSDKIDAEQDLTDEDLNKLGVKAVDDKTLEITTTTRVSFFDELMSFPCFYPINEKFAEKQGDKYGKSADSILGNGAFVMTNWEPGSVAEFEKNDKFYAAKDVKIDKLVMKLVQEPKVAAQAFEAGETDFAIINSDLVDKYKKDESFKNISEGFLFYVQPNLENADLANLNVRKALSLAINRKDLCENVLKDGSQAAKGFVPSGLSISPEGKDFRDEAATGTDESPMDVFATYLQNAFSSLKGLKIEMVATTKQDRIYNKQKKGDFDLSVTRWGPDYGDPTTYLTLALTDNNNNYGHWSNAEYDSIMGKVNSETDANARWQLMIDAEKILCEDLGYIPVFEKGTATLQNTKVKNLGIKPVGVPYTFEYVSK